MPVKWEDPPPAKSGRKSRVWWDRLEPLMEHPRRWALVREATSSAEMYRLKTRQYSYPPGRWEFTSRRDDDGRCRIYTRYLGPEEETRQ